MNAEHQKSIVVDLGYAVARLTYQLGWVSSDREWKNWRPTRDGVTYKSEVRLGEVVIFSPADCDNPAQSVYINGEGCAALREALSAPVPEIKE